MVKTTTADHSKEVGTSGDLEGLVVISGPCSSLPDRCTRRRQIPAPQYRPQVEHHDNTERLYSKHKLPLFEILHETNHLQDAQSNEDGPAAAVLRRRRQKRWCAAAEKGEGEEEEEDLTDEHYRRLHRKPEYLEKRVRNRELELYQYARWREAQMRNAEVASAVVVEEKHEAVGRPAKPNNDNDNDNDDKEEEDEEEDEGRDQTAVVASAKRQRVSNELKGLADSPGFAKAREKAASTPSATVAIAAEVKIPPATSVAPAGAASADPAEAERGDLPVLSLAERRAAHLGGCILEQLLVQAAHLPADEAREADSDEGDEGDEGDEDDDEDEGGGSESANNEEGDDEENSEDEEAGAVLGCCCPREFALPVRLYGHTMKQRDRG
ncbi:hypothetical protein LPJ66_001052 [Kickxella alabastrina]|uniref:Uncharacterized protein n=1 Tax=Kickxella alabastrina TaxID=61397 RepID=A0ACC1IUC7_9FUNG|nr:hypothetical protein LPJ66_001052 [Kickxella alabastrina]